MSRVILLLRAWLPLAVAITGVCALIFGSVQQVLRQGANDPQIEMAEDTALALDGGTNPRSLIPSARIDIARSLGTFLLVYDTSGKPLSGTGLLDGNLPEFPVGALQAARLSGENRVTWQPRPGVRVASVVVPFRAGYVVAGRSLREAEQRTAQMQTLAFVGWLVTLLASLAIAAAVHFLPARQVAG